MINLLYLIIYYHYHLIIYYYYLYYFKIDFKLAIKILSSSNNSKLKNQIIQNY